MELKKIIEKKDQMAQYMIDEITYICKNIEKRDPGSAGERKSCEYMGKVLKEDCGCETVELESFKENPDSFYGWIYITFTFVFAAMALMFVAPIVSAVLIVLGFALAFFQFGLYKKVVDKLFPEKEGTNLYAVKKCTGETKRRIIFNGHPDATWEWPVNYAFGGVGFEGHILISAAGALYYLVLSIITAVKTGVFGNVFDDAALKKAFLWGLIFVPFMFGMFFMWNKKRIVDGANDNLSGCYIGIAILKALKEEGIELENTEIGVMLSGSEEAGLRGSMAWAEKHKNDFNDVPTFIYAYDTIFDPKYLMVNYRDLNATVKADQDASDLFMEAAQELGIKCAKGMVPPLGGATDSAAFAKAGLRATGITGLNHNLQDYYHTRRDTYDNMNAEGLAGCYAVSVKVLEKFDNGEKQ